jgi:hypothetical protein
MKTLLLSLILFAQTLTTGLDIRVVDAVQEPVEGLHLTLTTYTYKDGQAYLRETQECDTDAQGNCTLLLEKPNQEGMQRATLQIGDHGSRDLIWPGGMMTLSIPLEQVNFGREAVPYEFQAEDGGVAVVEKKFPIFALLMLLFLGIIFWQVYRYAQSQEASK